MSLNRLTFTSCGFPPWPYLCAEPNNETPMSNSLSIHHEPSVMGRLSYFTTSIKYTRLEPINIPINPLPQSRLAPRYRFMPPNIPSLKPYNIWFIPYIMSPQTLNINVNLMRSLHYASIVIILSHRLHQFKSLIPFLRIVDKVQYICLELRV